VEHIAVFEVAHVKLAHRSPTLRPVSDSIDHKPARSADSFTAVMIEGDRIVTSGDQVLVENVEHFQERHVGIHFCPFVLDHPAILIRTSLAPDVESEPHYL
jgi:hypothetical protein